MTETVTKKKVTPKAAPTAVKEKMPSELDLAMMVIPSLIISDPQTGRTDPPAIVHRARAFAKAVLRSFEEKNE